MSLPSRDIVLVGAEDPTVVADYLTKEGVYFREVTHPLLDVHHRDREVTYFSVSRKISPKELRTLFMKKGVDFYMLIEDDSNSEDLKRRLERELNVFLRGAGLPTIGTARDDRYGSLARHDSLAELCKRRFYSPRERYERDVFVAKLLQSLIDTSRLPDKTPN